MGPRTLELVRSSPAHGPLTSTLSPVGTGVDPVTSRLSEGFDEILEEFLTWFDAA